MLAKLVLLPDAFPAAPFRPLDRPILQQCSGLRASQSSRRLASTGAAKRTDNQRPLVAIPGSCCSSPSFEGKGQTEVVPGVFVAVSAARSGKPPIYLSSA